MVSGAVVLALAAINVTDHLLHPPWWVRALEGAGLLAWARLDGLTWSQLGLGRDRLASGCRWGLGAIGVVAGVYVVGVLLPLTRPAFQDVRYDLPLPEALRTAFVVIPFGTVALEEIAFRSVLWGMLSRHLRPWQVLVTTSVLFGFWHVMPALHVGATNRGVSEAVGGSGSAARRRGNRRAHHDRRAGLRRAAPAQRQRARQRRRALGHQRPRRAVRAGGLAPGSGSMTGSSSDRESSAPARVDMMAVSITGPRRPARLTSEARRGARRLAGRVRLAVRGYQVPLSERSVPSAGPWGMLPRRPCSVFQRRNLWPDQASAGRALAVPPRGTSDAAATATTSSRCSPAPSVRWRQPPSAAG